MESFLRRPFPFALGTTLLMVVALFPSPSGSDRAAAAPRANKEPIEALWASHGAGNEVKIRVTPDGGGSFTGTVEESDNPCKPVGKVVWHATGSGQHYTGTVYWFYSDCTPIGDGTATFDISDDGNNLRYCSEDPSTPGHTECVDHDRVAPWVVITPSVLDGSAVNLRDTGGLDFGNVRFGDTSAPQTLTVKNGGSSTLNIKDVVMPGSGFQKGTDTCSGQAIPEDGTCTVEVTFAPPASTEQSGEIQITDDASDSPQYVSLRGTGTIGSRLPATVGREQGVSYGTKPCDGHTEFGKHVGWAFISRTPETVVGQVVEGHVATEDFTGPTDHTYHYNADYNWFLYPDQGDRHLLSRPGNFLVDEKKEFTESEAGRLEVEWERRGGTDQGRAGLPEWAWPAVGDKTMVRGWHILDCGHGFPDVRSEIHPPLFVATYRNAALAPFAGSHGRLGSYDPETDVPATRVDVFSSSYGGPAFGIEAENKGQWWQPVNSYTYEFDVMAPPKPKEDAELADPRVLVQRMDGNPSLTWTKLSNERGYHFTLQFLGGKKPDIMAYGANIWVEWKKDPNAPAPSLRTYEVTAQSIEVIHELTGKWRLYVYVNEKGSGSLLTGNGETSNHEKYRAVDDGDVISLHGRSFRVTLVEGQPLHVAFRVASEITRLGTSFGDAKAAGTVARFYRSPTFFSASATLRGSASLGDDSLGMDELNKGCPCYLLTFMVQRLSP